MFKMYLDRNRNQSESIVRGTVSLSQRLYFEMSCSTIFAAEVRFSVLLDEVELSSSAALTVIRAADSLASSNER